MPRIEEKAGTYFITFSLKDRDNPLSLVERSLVFQHILMGDREHFILNAVAVMSDHVHVILQAQNGTNPIPLPEIARRIKGASARMINLRRGVPGGLWVKRYHNRLLFTTKHYFKAMEYVLDNPVHHNETSRPENYLFLCFQGRGSILEALERIKPVLTGVNDQSCAEAQPTRLLMKLRER